MGRHKDKTIQEDGGFKIVQRTKIPPPLGVPQPSIQRFVPIVQNGLEGLTSCCNGMAKYYDTTLCCGSCYKEVAPFHINSERLQTAIQTWLRDPNDTTYENLKATQKQVLTEIGRN